MLEDRLADRLSFFLISSRHLPVVPATDYGQLTTNDLSYTISIHVYRESSRGALCRMSGATATFGDLRAHRVSVYITYRLLMPC